MNRTQRLETLGEIESALASTKNPWRMNGSRTIYQNPWLRLREDSVVRPDGSLGIYSVLELPMSVGIAAIDDEQNIGLVLQWRYVHGMASLEIPTGSSSGDDSDLEVTAKRELLEETGLRAGSILRIGTVQNSNGATTDMAHLYIARELSMDERPPQTDELTELLWLPFDVAVDAVKAGLISESVSVATILQCRVQGLL